MPEAERYIGLFRHDSPLEGGRAQVVTRGRHRDSAVGEWVSARCIGTPSAKIVRRGFTLPGDAVGFAEGTKA